MLTQEQKQKRLGKITSSVAAACLGVDEYKSPIDAWLEIRGEGPGDDEMSPEMAKACDRGNILEGTILAWGGEQLGMDLFEAPFREHADHDWLGDSADGLYVARGNGGAIHCAEAKSVALGGAHHYGAEMTEDMPVHTLVQSHMHLAHHPDAESCYVPVCIGGYVFEFRLYRVLRNPGWEEEMINRLGEWHHEFIIGDKPPPATWRDSDRGFLVKRFGDRDKEPTESTPEIEEWAQKKALASQRVKDAKEEEATAKNRLRELLGHHELVDAEWGKVTWRRNKSSYPVDHETMANELLAGLAPGVAEACIAAHTREKPGNMVLNVNLSKALKKELGL